MYINLFRRRATLFNGQAIETNFLLHNKKNFPLDGQTRWVKSSSQLINLPCAAPNETPDVHVVSALWVPSVKHCLDLLQKLQILHIALKSVQLM